MIRQSKGKGGGGGLRGEQAGERHGGGLKGVFTPSGKLHFTLPIMLKGLGQK